MDGQNLPHEHRTATLRAPASCLHIKASHYLNIAYVVLYVWIQLSVGNFKIHSAF